MLGTYLSARYQLQVIPVHHPATFIFWIILRKYPIGVHDEVLNRKTTFDVTTLHMRFNGMPLPFYILLLEIDI